MGEDRHLFVAEYFKDGKYIIHFTCEKKEIYGIMDKAVDGISPKFYYADSKKEEKEIINHVLKNTNYCKMLSSNLITYNVIDYINQHYRRGVNG